MRELSHVMLEVAKKTTTIRTPEDSQRVETTSEKNHSADLMTYLTPQLFHNQSLSQYQVSVETIMTGAGDSSNSLDFTLSQMLPETYRVRRC